MADLIKEEYTEVDIIAGVATGAIAVGALVADALDLPFLYVRSSSKGHGLGNQIEGDLTTGNNVVVVEDLISTGMSSLNAVVCLREANFNVLGMTSIFTYGFDVAKINFENEHCSLHCLSDYNHLLEAALQNNYIDSTELEALKSWRVNPEIWKTA